MDKIAVLIPCYNEEKTIEKAPAKRRVTVRRPQENAKSRGMER